MSEIHLFGVYCERTGEGLWAEPLNTLSNFAFIIAGIAAWRYYRKFSDESGAKDWDIKLLIVLLFCIGGGSLLWHMLARPWAELADAIPILLFISIYIVSFLWRVAGLKPLVIIIFFGLFQLINNGMLLFNLKDILNGSLFYAPTLITLVLFTLYLFNRQHPHRNALLISTLLFLISIFLRTIDQLACQLIATGTHYFWHILNAVILYRIIVLLIDPKNMVDTKVRIF